MGLLGGWKERWQVEGRKNPVGHLPEHLTMPIIYGTEEESRKAYSELFALARTTGLPILDAELEYLADARDQVGFSSRLKPQSENSPIKAAAGLIRRLLPKKGGGE